MRNPSVLISGASGFLGKRVADACRAEGFALHGADLRGPEIPDEWRNFSTGPLESLEMDQLLASQPFRFCFHLAGAASVPASMENPLGDFSSLMPGTARLLSALARSDNAPVLVLFSSAAVYGSPSELPVTEDQPLNPVSPYGIHKVLAEEMVANYARLYGLNAVILRIFSAFGAGLRKQLFWDLSRKAQKAVAAGDSSLELGGTGTETRDFIHAEDVARAALATAKAAEETPGCRTYNVASGEETTIRAAAETLLDATGAPLSLAFNGKVRPGDPPRWVADISRLRALGFQPSRTLAGGLAAYAKWFQSLPFEERS